jgi:hypothetical protein
MKTTTSKKLIAFLFLNCTALEIFSCYVILRSLEIGEMTGMTPDMSPLNTLIGAIIGQVLAYAVYAAKATKENTKGGIIYDAALGDGMEDIVPQEDILHPERAAQFLTNEQNAGTEQHKIYGFGGTTYDTGY